LIAVIVNVGNLARLPDDNSWFWLLGRGLIIVSIAMLVNKDYLAG
jgi:hypothetical protein